MTHTPMLTDFVARTLNEGGRVVHYVEDGIIQMNLEDSEGQVILFRVFAEIRYLLDNGIANVISERLGTINNSYERVIT